MFRCDIQVGMIRFGPHSLHWSIRLISTAQVRIYADWTGSARLTDESRVADGPADARDGESDGWNGDDATRHGLRLGMYRHGRLCW